MRRTGGLAYLRRVLLADKDEVEVAEVNDDDGDRREGTRVDPSREVRLGLRLGGCRPDVEVMARWANSGTISATGGDGDPICFRRGDFSMGST